MPPTRRAGDEMPRSQEGCEEVTGSAPQAPPSGTGSRLTEGNGLIRDGYPEFWNGGVGDIPESTLYESES